MAKTFVTPLMLLTLPTPGQEPGPDWANDLNVAMETVDSHDHTAGKGTPVPATGLYIGSDLNWNSNNVLGLRSSRFISQTGALSTSDDKSCIYFSNGDFFVNDSAGHQIQLTASGGLNAASIGGIGGDYAGSGASVSYSSTTKTFSFTQAASQTAKVFLGDIAIAETVPGAQAITIKSPTGLSTAYTSTLPSSIPTTGQQFLISDATGQQSYLPYNSTNFEIAANIFRIKDDGITTSKVLNQNITNAKLAPLNESFSPVINALNYYTASIGTSTVDVAGMSCTLTSVGRPVMIEFSFDLPSGNNPGVNLTISGAPSGGGGTIFLIVDGVMTAYQSLSGLNGANNFYPYSQFRFRVPLSAGTHTFKIQCNVASSAGSVNLNFASLVLWAREL
jgi:hypothetical protein